MATPIMLEEYLTGLDIHDGSLESNGRDRETTMVERVCLNQAMGLQLGLEFRDRTPRNAADNLNWQAVIASLKQNGWEGGERRVLGTKSIWITSPDATHVERKNGYRISTIIPDEKQPEEPTIIPHSDSVIQRLL